MIKSHSLYRQRGRAGRLKKTPILAGGLWSKLQNKPSISGNFSTKLIHEVFGDISKIKWKAHNPPPRDIIGYAPQQGTPEEQLAQRQKLQEKLGIRILTNEEWEEQNTL